MSYQDENGKIYGVENEDKNIVLFYAETGEPVTRLDENVYPVGSDFSARYEHPEGVVLEYEDAKNLGIEIEKN